MMDKIHYFLKTFRGKEWSGPAWYSHEKNENGFPTNIKLEYFHVLDLGTRTSTDWDGADLIKILGKLRKKHSEIGKTWVQGNIHSHNELGAFFSGTDKDQLRDGANDQFYYSLVVSTTPGKEFKFGVSYPDQFGVIHIVNIDDVETEVNFTVDKSWKQEAKLIQKREKSSYISSYVNSVNGQGTLFGETLKTQSELEQLREMRAYNSSFFQEETEMTAEQEEQFENAYLDFERGRLSKAKFKKTLKKIGVDEYGEPLPT